MSQQSLCRLLSRRGSRVVVDLRRRSLSMPAAGAINTHLSDLPKRHSRHAMPPTCVSGAQLIALTQELLEARPGSLYTYHEGAPSSDGEDESLQAWQAADASVQKAEFVLRGHAAQIPNTIWNRVLHKKPFFEQLDYGVSPIDRIETMKSVIQRLDEEGKLYMKLRHEVKSQLALEQNLHESTDESTSMDDIYTKAPDKDVWAHLGEEQNMEDFEEMDMDDMMEGKIPKEDFASPGPTVAMYDVLLDAMAVTTHAHTPTAVGNVFEEALLRDYHDGGPESNDSVFTVPTRLTFNGVLRAVANTPYNGEERIRDDALTVSFSVYDVMRLYISRNSATYAYMLETIAKYLPTSRSRGNIAHGMFTQGQKERVIDPTVLDALHLAHTPSNGEEFDAFMDKFINGKDLKDLPPKWKRDARARRYNKREATY